MSVPLQTYSTPLAELVNLLPQVRRWERETWLPASLARAEVPRDLRQRRSLEEWFLGGDLDLLDMSGIRTGEVEYVRDCVRDLVKIRHARLLRTILRRCGDTWKLVVLEVASAEPQLAASANKLIHRLGPLGAGACANKHKREFHSCILELSVIESFRLLHRCVSASLVDRLRLKGRAEDVQQIVASDVALASFFAADPDKEGWLASPNKTQRLAEVCHGAIPVEIEMRIDTLHRDRVASMLVKKLSDPKYGKGERMRQQLRADWGTRLLEACWSVPTIERRIRDNDPGFAAELFKLTDSARVPTSLRAFMVSQLSFAEMYELWWETDRVRRREQRRIERSDVPFADISISVSSTAEETAMAPPKEVIVVWYSRLNDTQREVVELFYFEKKSIAEIARILKRDRSSIQERWDRADARLSTTFAEWADGELDPFRAQGVA